MNYEFFRVYNGRAMASGVRIEQESSLSDATESAHKLIRRIGDPFDTGYGRGEDLFLSTETGLEIEKEGTKHAEKLDNIREILDGDASLFDAFSEIRKVLDGKDGE